MNLIRSIFLGMVTILSGAQAASTDELSNLKTEIGYLQYYDSKNWEKDNLVPADWKRIQEAEAYVQTHHEVLVRIVTNKEDGWQSCAYALGRTKNPEIVLLYIRLLRENFYLKGEDGSRMEFGFGTKNDCEEIPNEYGSVLAYYLGMIGDKRALPSLREAVVQGDSAVRKNAYCALFKLGEYSFDQILDKLGEISFGESLQQTETDPNGPKPDTVMAIIDEVRVSDPERAIELYDRVISKFPAKCSEVARAHFSKILCYEDLKKYDLALQQCEVFLQKGYPENSTKRIPEIKERITKRSQQNDANQHATDAGSKLGDWENYNGSCPKGYYPIVIQGEPLEGDGTTFRAIFAKIPNPDFKHVAIHGLGSEQYEKKQKDLSRQGYMLIYHQEFMAFGGLTHQAIWVKQGPP